jgi:hypothetical protein
MMSGYLNGLNHPADIGGIEIWGVKETEINKVCIITLPKCDSREKDVHCKNLNQVSFMIRGAMTVPGG